MPLCFLKMGALQLELTACHCLLDSCSSFCLFSLTLLLLLLVLDSECSFSAEFLTTIRTKIQASICRVKCSVSAAAVLVCVGHTQPGQVPLWHRHVWSLQAEPPAWAQGSCQPSAGSQDLLLFHIFRMLWLLLPPQLSTLQDFTPTKGGKKQKKQ